MTSCGSSPVDDFGSERASVRYGAFTAIGPRSGENQDCYFADPVRGIFLIFDGIGGSPGGAEASALARRSLSQCFASCWSDGRERALQTGLARGLRLARQRIKRAGLERLSWRNMGTCMAAALMVGPQLYFAHIGDCRVYLMSDGALQQLTRDQTFVQAMLEIDAITPGEAQEHPLRHVILNSLSAEPLQPHPRLSIHPLQPSDRLLLTTDGVTDVLPNAQIAELLSAKADLADLARQLVIAAYAHNSRDNATCIVACQNP